MPREARITARSIAVPAVVMAKAAGMKDPWCLVTSLTERGVSEIVQFYGHRFMIEETYS